MYVAWDNNKQKKKRENSFCFFVNNKKRWRDYFILIDFISIHLDSPFIIVCGGFSPLSLLSFINPKTHAHASPLSLPLSWGFHRRDEPICKSLFIEAKNFIFSLSFSPPSSLSFALAHSFIFSFHFSFSIFLFWLIDIN